MEGNEDHVQTLLSMGFGEVESRRALRLGKNDLNEAVAILTNEHPTQSYDALEDIDVEMKDVQGKHGSSNYSPYYGPAPPPSYEEIMHSDRQKVGWA